MKSRQKAAEILRKLAENNADNSHSSVMSYRYEISILTAEQERRNQLLSRCRKATPQECLLGWEETYSNDFEAVTLLEELLVKAGL